MDFFKRLFGRSCGPDKKEKGRRRVADAGNKAINDIKSTAELLERKQKFLEQKIKEENNNILTHGSKNKARAMRHLQRRKLYEKQLQQLIAAQATMENQMLMIESAHANVEVVGAMKEGHTAMAKIQHEIGTPERLGDLMDDIEEQHIATQEIADTISAPLGALGGPLVDEDDLAHELAALEGEVTVSGLVQVPEAGVAAPTTPHLPPVPAATPGGAQPAGRASEAELEALREWAT